MDGFSYEALIHRDLRQLADQQDRQRSMEGGQPSGSSFPAAPTSGFRFFRSDLGLDCYYDGARWVARDLVTVGRDVTGIAAATSVPVAPIRQDYAPYVVRVTIDYIVATTNNSTNYWGVTLRGVNTAYSAASGVHSFDTRSAGLAWAQEDAAPNVSATPSNRARFDLDLTRTGAPGSLSIYVTVYYRLIVT